MLTAHPPSLRAIGQNKKSTPHPEQFHSQGRTSIWFRICSIRSDTRQLMNPLQSRRPKWLLNQISLLSGTAGVHHSLDSSKAVEDRCPCVETGYRFRLSRYSSVIAFFVVRGKRPTKWRPQLPQKSNHSFFSPYRPCQLYSSNIRLPGWISGLKNGIAVVSRWLK
jgi:hypothetical protein